MDALGSIKPVTSAPVTVKAATVLPNPPPSTPLPSIGGGDGQGSFDAQVAEVKRQETLVNAARSAPQPLGSQTFTMFKDATGQIITRYREGDKVTYIPEPQLLRNANVSNGTEALVNIKV